MIGDGGNSGFMGFGLLGLWVFGCLIFLFFVGFGYDCGLWLKWQFGGCVGGGLVAMVVFAVGCVGGGLIFFFFLAVGCVGLWLWMCWWWSHEGCCHGLWLSHEGCC